jgi:hypothetical protein
MNPRKNIFLILLLGLLLVAFTAVAAQTPAQGDQKKKTESCCATESCCSGDSCEMKKEGESNTESAEGKHDCCGESCDMKKHDAKMKHDKDHKGDCCNMKNKKTKKTA